MYITDSASSIWHRVRIEGEAAMKARVLLESASLGPDDLKVAFQAFDGAWKEIAARYANPDVIGGARMRLATLILSLMSETKDANEMQAIAVQEMSKRD
jgi:hypothetical protein